MSVLTTFPIAVFSAAMIFAGVRDLTTMTIPNWLTLALTLTFFVAAPIIGMSLTEIAQHTVIFFVTLLVGMGFFAMGWIGGGDAKLMAAVALWIGWEQALPYFLIASVMGGGLTLLILGYRNLPLPAFMVRQAWALRLHDRSEGVPYGLALAAAGLLIFPDTEIFRLTVAIG
ncbi:MAG: prepilin peptidase [Parvibaculum sp.]|nr:prepilin peptidase [Parvibaculum sp.]